jgi:site-specific DNA recombinase
MSPAIGCRNKATIRRAKLEGQVLDLLGRQLMQPALVEAFVEAFNEEWQRLAGEVKAQAASRRRERAVLDRKIANLVDAIGDGRSSPAILAKLTDLEGQRAQLGDQVEMAIPFVPALHPGIAHTYAAKVEELREALMKGQDPEALEAARALIDKVIIHPANEDGNSPGIELLGELMGLLQAVGIACPDLPGALGHHNNGLSEVLGALTAQSGALGHLTWTSP